MKAYILKIDTPISNEYAECCSLSCDNVGLDWEYYNGFQNMTGAMAMAKLGIRSVKQEPYRFIENPNQGQKAMCATAGHFGIWQKIAAGEDEAAIILEHDAIMLHPINISIPDNQIVVLGYKLVDTSKYDHIAAGPPTQIIKMDGHEGAHAYAITKKTAQTLLEEIAERGIRSAIDNDYFIRPQRITKVPISIMAPTPAIGWLRKSTIWAGSASKNYKFIPAFQRFYK